MKKIAYGISIITLMLGLNGCIMSTENVQINKDISQLENKTLTYKKQQSKLKVLTPLKVITSGLIKDGNPQKAMIDNLYNDLNGDFSIANYLSVNLTKDMSNKYNFKLKYPNNELKEIDSKFTNSDYIIDIRVPIWKVMYYKFKFGKYYIILWTTMTLVDTKTNEIISQGYCQKETQYDENNPLTYDTLFNNNAKGLIEETKTLSNSCFNQYKKLLKI